MKTPTVPPNTVPFEHLSPPQRRAIEALDLESIKACQFVVVDGVAVGMHFPVDWDRGRGEPMTWGPDEFIMGDEDTALTVDRDGVLRSQATGEVVELRDGEYQPVEAEEIKKRIEMAKIDISAAARDVFSPGPSTVVGNGEFHLSIAGHGPAGAPSLHDVAPRSHSSPSGSSGEEALSVPSSPVVATGASGDTVWLPVEWMAPSGWQSGREEDPHLVEVFQASGFDASISRLLVRPCPPCDEPRPKYQIIIGERRWKSAVKAGLKEIACTVRDLSDAEALRLQLLENLGRKDLTPMQEAEAVARLLSLRGADDQPVETLESLAQKLGKSVEYVRLRRVVASLLPDEVTRAAAMAGTLSLAHVRYIAAIPSVEIRDFVATQALKPRTGAGSGMSKEELVHYIREEVMRQLKGARFDIARADLVAPVYADGANQDATLHGTDCSESSEEELISKCIEVMQQEKKASTSLFQRRFRLGYTHAARICDILEERGYVGPGEGAKPREILPKTFEAKVPVTMPKRVTYDSEQLYGGSCLSCPAMSVNFVERNGDEFACGSRTRMCLNPACFRAKEEAEHREWMEVQRVRAAKLAGGASVEVLGMAEGRPHFNEAGTKLLPSKVHVVLDDAPDPGDVVEAAEGRVKPWAELIHGRAVPITVARMPESGKAVMLIPKAEALTAAQENGHGPLFKKALQKQAPTPEDTKPEDTLAPGYKTATDAAAVKEEQRRRAELKVEEEDRVTDAQVSALVAKARATKGMPADMLRLVGRRIVSMMNGEVHWGFAAKFLGLTSDVGDSWSGVLYDALGQAPDEKLPGLVVALAALSDPLVHYKNDLGAECRHELAADLEVDLKKVEREALAALKAEREAVEQSKACELRWSDARKKTEEFNWEGPKAINPSRGTLCLSGVTGQAAGAVIEAEVYVAKSEKGWHFGWEIRRRYEKKAPDILAGDACLVTSGSCSQRVLAVRAGLQAMQSAVTADQHTFPAFEQWADLHEIIRRHIEALGDGAKQARKGAK